MQEEIYKKREGAGERIVKGRWFGNVASVQIKTRENEAREWKSRETALESGKKAGEKTRERQRSPGFKSQKGTKKWGKGCNWRRIRPMRREDGGRLNGGCKSWGGSRGQRKVRSWEKSEIEKS